MGQLFFNLAEAISLFVLLAFVAGRVGILARIFSRPLRWRERLAVAVASGLLGIMGTYWGIPVEGAIANTRVIGPMIAGLFGGPGAGLAAGLIAGIHRYTLGGFTALACGISTVSEGFLAGTVHRLVTRRGRQVTAVAAFAATAVAEMLQMAIILLVARPWDDAVSLVSQIALPMILTNALGVGLMVGIIRDAREQQDRIAATQAQTVLEIASRTLPHLRAGLSETSALAACEIILPRTEMLAVAITDREKILAFAGAGADHHLAGLPPMTQATRDVLADGRERVVQRGTEAGCSVPDCPLIAGVAVPLRDRDQVVGTLSLYQRGNGPVRQVTVELGVGLGNLLSSQIELSRAQAMTQLVAQAELRALHAQINPHFLFNALGTIGALCRRDPEKARDLLVMLSQYLRSSMRVGNEMVTLGEELGYVEAYLAVEKTRFGERLRVDVEVETDALDLLVPILCLQPLVENSVRHGIMPKAQGGSIRILGRREGEQLVLSVTDDGVGMEASTNYGQRGHGVGLTNVRERLRYLYGLGDWVEVVSSPGAGTAVRLRLPVNVNPTTAVGVKPHELLSSSR